MRPHTHISGYTGMIVLCAAALCLFPATAALAQVGDTLCWIYDYAMGTASGIGRGIATIGVASLALAAMFGKVTWGMAITVAVGIVGLFGAATLYWNLIGVGSC